MSLNKLHTHSRSLLCFKSVLVASDFVNINMVAMFSLFLMSAFHVNMHETEYVSQHFRSFLASYNLIWAFSALIFRSYHDDTLMSVESIYRKTLRMWLLQLSLFFVWMFFTNRLEHALYFWVLVLFVQMLAYGLSRVLTTALYYQMPKYFHSAKAIALIGSDLHISDLGRFIKDDQPFYKANLVTDIHWVLNADNSLDVSCFERSFNELVSGRIFEAYVSVPSKYIMFIPQLQQVADRHGVEVGFIPHLATDERLSWDVSHESTFQLILARKEPMSSIYNRYKKRLVDILFSTAVILFLMSWLVPILAIIIKIQSPGPVFFKQLRSGRHNIPFYCYKFRSMTVNRSSDQQQASKGDARITKIGAFMRKTSVDELPQFFNVLFGDMSVVGPRPHMLAHTEHYRQLIDTYMVRHHVKPGITGWAQVNGYRGETKDPKLMEKRVEFDVFYLENWTAMLDAKIVVLTVLNAAKGEENAY